MVTLIANTGLETSLFAKYSARLCAIFLTLHVSIDYNSKSGENSLTNILNGPDKEI